MILVYDCETSGLPEWKKPSLDPMQPHIIQLAGILFDNKGTEIERMCRYVKPNFWRISDDIFKLTGISQELLESDGLPIADVIAEFMAIVEKTRLCVAHNDSFDRRMVRIELLRLHGEGKIAEDWKSFPSYCTKNESIKVAQIAPTDKMMAAGFKTFKSPKLAETYEYLFGTRPEKMHDALADCESTAKVYFELIRRG